MSADPDEPVAPGRLTGGYVIKNMIYRHEPGNKVEIVTGWSDQGCREYNQEIVPPAREGMHAKHPCYALNQSLLQCSQRCPDEMRLAGRIASCNDERKVLMQCVTRNKGWVPPQKAWYQLW